MDQLLWITFCISNVYTKTNTLEYKGANAVENAKKLDIRHMTTEIVFLPLGSTILVSLKTTEAKGSFLTIYCTPMWYDSVIKVCIFDISVFWIVLVISWIRRCKCSKKLLQIRAKCINVNKALFTHLKAEMYKTVIKSVAAFKLLLYEYTVNPSTTTTCEMVLTDIYNEVTSLHT